MLMKLFIIFLSVVFMYETNCTATLSVNVTRGKTKKIGLKTLITKKIIPTINNPHVVVWYSGEDGLTERSFNFYDKNLIRQLENQRDALNKKNQNPRFYLYDLSAWKGLRDAETSFDTQYNMVPVLEHINNTRSFNALYSADFFTFINSCNEQIAQCISDIMLKREFIWQISAQNNQRTDKLNNYQLALSSYRPIALEKFLSTDTFLLYSALQYLEGIYLSLLFIKKNRGRLDNLNIAFALQRGESDYYFDGQNIGSNSFQEDLITLLSLDAELSDTQGNVNIYFFEFDYNSPGTSGPYTMLTDDIPWKKQS